MEPSRNFDLRLSGTLSAVSVEVIDSPAGQTTAPTVLPCTVSPQTLSDLHDEMASAGDLQTIGRALWRCAFGAPSVAELWRASRAEVGSDGVLRLRLTIDAAELAALPWELLYDETLGRFLALDAQTPVTRFTRLPIPSVPWPQDRPLRLLFTGASPSDMPTLRVVQEWEGIEQMIASLVKDKRLEISDPLHKGATLPSLLAALRRKVDIWHFAGHGTDNGLIFCKDHNKANPVDAGELGHMLRGEGVRLAVINACRAGAGGGQAASVAGALLRAKIPSVVAMQANVSDVAADTFAGAFYDAIAVGQDVDQAVTSARKAIWAAGTHEWWTPALFMRTPEGRIWRMPVKGAESEARARELAYLDGVIKKYQYWEEKYTPLAGVAEVRVAATDSLQLDLPAPFVPAGFMKLVEHGFGLDRRTERVPVGDLREAVAKYRRLLILGEPGSGKTTTLWRLAYDYAVAARKDSQAPLPLLVPLDAYSGPESALAYAQGYFEELSSHLPAYLRSKRVILLLDALNQMPQADRKERVERIQALLNQHPDVSVVVTSRPIDDGNALALALDRVEASPLDPGRQLDYLSRYLGNSEGTTLFWQLAGSAAFEGWCTWRQAGGHWEQFWIAAENPQLNWQIFHEIDEEGNVQHARPPNGISPFLVLGRNPYNLLMMMQVYVASRGGLAHSRGELVAAMVDTLLTREKERCDSIYWPGAHILRRNMMRMALAMQQADRYGTAVDVRWASMQMRSRDSARIIQLCTHASLLNVSGTQVSFAHQLFQEYFAALALADRLKGVRDFVRFLPKDWDQARDWEGTFVLLAGMLPDMASLVMQLLPDNPMLAASCIVENSGAASDDEIVASVQQRLVTMMTDSHVEIPRRDAAGIAINRLGDPRPGVGLRPDGLPDIDWVLVPLRDPHTGYEEFIFGEAYYRTVPEFWMARYPITYLQFQAFLDAPDGFVNPEWWIGLHFGASWRAFLGSLTDDLVSLRYGWGDQEFKYGNHPRETVSWSDAMAFCRWLTTKAKVQPDILPYDLRDQDGWRITLPTERQWEKAARGHSGRLYPWGREFRHGYANLMDDYWSRAGCLKKTSAVGIYPHEAPDDSPYGIADLCGNVMEWCRTPYDGLDAYGDTAVEHFMMRGGCWDDYPMFATNTSWRHGHQDYRSSRLGFRLVSMGCVSLALTSSALNRNLLVVDEQTMK